MQFFGGSFITFVEFEKGCKSKKHLPVTVLTSLYVQMQKLRDENEKYGSSYNMMEALGSACGEKL